ncbi:response regulator [Thermogemmatispora sp.]|uniref:response regulator n=1 Tax=Thermogemmatispora sp. TaxID=1968838 RepID=UPI001DAC9A96|nr:response regulator [Thermogemmatispora sp.]MBX5449683.1 response regulator [Thermogemmatispora sp.]
MSNTFDKLSVLDSFIEEVKSYLPEIEANLDRLAHSPGDMDALEETYRRTHTIGGSASMMDFPGLAHVAHGMEDILGDVLDGLATLDEPTLALLRRSLRRLHVLIDGIRDNSVNQDAIIAEDDADYSRYRALQEAAGKVVPGSAESASAPTLPATEPSSSQSLSASSEHYKQYEQNAAHYQDQWTDQPGYQSQPQQAYQDYQQDSPHYHAPTQSSQRYDFLEGGLGLGEAYSYQQRSAPASSPQSTPAPESPYPAPQEGPLPSFDEMLAAFRTPSVPAEEEPLWPEDPVPLAQQSPEVSAASPSPPTPPTPSALDMLAASFRGESSSPAAGSAPAPQQEPSHSPRTPSPLEELVHRFTATHPEAQGRAPASETSPSAVPDWAQPQQPQPSAYYPQQPQQSTLLSPAGASSLSQAPGPTAGRSDDALVLPASASRLYHDLQQEALSLEEQANTLHTLLAQLQQAVGVIEDQRSEFRGFLDGSKDALERMEDWAGQAMGLNLRKSPEKVRRYLPLSVMWVVNTKLKKVLELLSRITNDVQATDEQIQTTLQQLRGTIEACGDLLERLPQALTNQEAGWTPWQVQVSRDASGVRERVTFERQGDLAALRAELEAKIREELRREYEQRPLSLAARMELERQIREEVRQEFERQRQLQREIVGPDGQESYEELVKRLRNEIEIEVRREFLAQLTGSADLEAVTNLQQTGSGPLPALEIPRAQVSPPPVVAPPPPVSPASAPPSASATGGSAVSEGTDFGEEAAEIFRLEAEEHLQTISMNVAALEKSPEDRDILQSIRRATHTLKGAAGMMGFRLIADLCHVSEDLLDSIMEGQVAITPAVIGIILDTAETLDRLINNRGEDRATLEAAVAAMRARYAELLGEQQLSPPPAEEELESLLDSGEGADSSTLSSTVAEAAPAAGELLMQRSPAAELSVRVRLQKLDELVNLFGELLVNRSALEEHIQRLMRLVADVSMSSERLRDVGQKLESRFEAATLPSGRVVQVLPGTGNGSSRLPALQTARSGSASGEPAHLAEFDELELDRYTEFHQLTRGLSEGVSDMITLSSEMEAVIRECESIFARESRLSTTFQDRLMKTRLVPLSSMIPRLYRAVRSVALKQHKEINFVTEGEDTEVDRTVYEEIAGPLLHLMRNAVNHAIEEPEVRIRKGKPPAGLVKLSASYEGNQVVITVRDDGTGIDPEKVRQAAIARGLIRPDQVLSPSDVIDLIFRPGFSTAEVVSEESGRGVGLDVVRDSISRLRATLEVDSTPGQGTAFTMKFPTSLAIQSVMMVRVGDQQYAIPTTLVEAIGRLDTFKRTTHAGRPAVVVQNDVYPLSQLAFYLKLPAGEIEERSPLLLVNTGRHRVALVVDEVKTRMDVVMKNLGPHLRHVHGIAGGTVLGNGRVILILELNELLSVQRRGSGAIAATLSQPQESRVMAPASPAQVPTTVATTPTTVTVNTSSLPAVRPPISPLPSPRAERGRHVLVVDDSPSVRRVVSNMLKQHGWEVQTARDGVEALEMISSQPPAAVLLDIEMPRMDGYELMATVRSQEQYRTLPLVVLTSRAASKHKQRAMQLGASAYIVKPYQDEELISTLNRLVYGASA